jgi:hypothetical protein
MRKRNLPIDGVISSFPISVAVTVDSRLPETAAEALSDVRYRTLGLYGDGFPGMPQNDRAFSTNRADVTVTLTNDVGARKNIRRIFADKNIRRTSGEESIACIEVWEDKPC